MGYSDIKAKKQREADAARIKELEKKLKEAENKAKESAKSATLPPQQPAFNPYQQPVVVKNEGCLDQLGKGCGAICLAVIGIIIGLAALGRFLIDLKVTPD